MTIFVGVGEFSISNNRGDVIKTMALGSCIGVVAYSRKMPISGLLHLQLPESSINLELAKQRPAMFADTGIPLFLHEFEKLGCSARDLTIKLVGGAQVMDPQNTFNIGKRNYLATKKILWANRLWPAAEDVGGNHSRTVTLKVGEDTVVLTCPGKPDWSI